MREIFQKILKKLEHFKKNFKSGMTLILQLNIYQFIRYNFFSKRVHREKHKFIYPCRHGKILLQDNAEIIVKGSLVLNRRYEYQPKAGGILFMRDNSKLIINSATRFSAGCHIEMLSDGVLTSSNAYFQSGCRILCADSITFEKGSGMSWYSSMRDSSVHPTGTDIDNLSVSSGPIRVGKHAWIGEKTIVYPGTDIGDCCIIGYGSRVSGVIPPHSMVAPRTDSVVLSDVYWFNNTDAIKEELKYYSDDDVATSNSIPVYRELHNDISSKVKSVFVDLGYESIESKNDLIGLKIIDSLSLISVITALSETFGIRIPVEDINSRSFYNIYTIAGLIEQIKKDTLEANNVSGNSIEQEPIDKELLELDINDTGKTIVQRILENAIRCPARKAIITNEREVTYSELGNMIYRYSEVLKKDGVCFGDKVVLQALCDVRYCALFYACHLIGAVPVPVEKEIGEGRLTEIAEEVEAKLVICESSLEIKRNLSFEDIDSGTDNSSEIPFFSLTFPNIDDPAQILFTTGTTGRSKGVVTQHKAISYAAYSAALKYGVLSNDVHFTVFPLNHAGGLWHMHVILANGQSYAVCDGMRNMSEIKELISRYKVSSMHMPPVAYAMLAELVPDVLSDNADRISYIVTGSAPISTQCINKLRELLPDTRIISTYGASESMFIAGMDCDSNGAFLGTPDDGVEIRITDCSTGSIICQAERIGKISIKSPTVMKEYYNQPQQTDIVLHDGWLSLGDLGFFDENGNLHHAGRADDVINIGGYKTSPVEIESIVNDSGMAAESILIESKDRYGQSFLELLVVPQTESFDTDAVKSLIESRVEAYRVPKRITIVDKIEKTYNGKIDRKSYRN